MTLKEKIDVQKLPRHVAIIMDGNGRWAKQHQKSRIYGHQNGVQAVRDTVEACAELGISYLTLYAFSAENWNRPQKEIDALMELLVEALREETDQLNENDVRLKVIGNWSNLPDSCQQELQKAIELTQGNEGLTLVLALSYSARQEITKAVQQIGRDILEENIKINQITPSLLQRYLDTREIPNPELLIRTSGENRISNFLLWQIAYAELYFTPTLWPDFNKEELYKAVFDFQQRERRFGKISEQLSE